MEAVLWSRVFFPRLAPAPGLQWICKVILLQSEPETLSQQIYISDTEILLLALFKV